MKSLTVPKPSFVNLILAIAIVAIATVFACTSESEEDTPTSEPEVAASTADLDCPDLEEPPGVGDTPLGPPPGMPYIFAGTAYIDGQPAPEGEMLYVKLTASRSHAVEILENGKYRDIIHGPVHPPDNDVPFVFCLGDPEGVAVKANETVDYENTGTFEEVELDLNFPMGPGQLNAQ